MLALGKICLIALAMIVIAGFVITVYLMILAIHEEIMNPKNDKDNA